MSGNQTKGSGRKTREELLEALDRMNAGETGEGDGMGIGEDDAAPALSEAELLAALADKPKMRVDGRPKGTERQRQLTDKQKAFAQGLIEGKTQIQAYRDAYPDAKGNTASIKASAYKLAKDERVQAIVNEGWDETVEALVDDQHAVKRYVLKQLLHHSKTAKQEGTRLKALEMMGKSAGLFTPTAGTDDDKAVTPEQLKRELSAHLRMLNNIRPMTRAAVLQPVMPVIDAVPMPMHDAMHDAVPNDEVDQREPG